MDCTCSGFPPKIGDRQRSRAASYAQKNCRRTSDQSWARVVLIRIPWRDGKGDATERGWFRLRGMAGDDSYYVMNGEGNGGGRGQRGGGLRRFEALTGVDGCRKEQGQDAKAGRVERPNKEPGED